MPLNEKREQKARHLYFYTLSGLLLDVFFKADCDVVLGFSSANYDQSLARRPVSRGRYPRMFYRVCHNTLRLACRPS